MLQGENIYNVQMRWRCIWLYRSGVEWSL